MKTQNLSLAWQICLMVMLSAVAITAPDLSFANDSSIGNALCSVASWFGGSAGKGIATIGISIIGIGALLGKVSWGMAIIVGIGVIIIFGSSALITSIASSGSGCAN